MSYFHTCEYCGANLDPGEKCDYQQSIDRKLRKRRKYLRRYMEENHGTDQFEREHYKFTYAY